MNFTDGHGSTTITDGSSNAITITANGDAVTIQPEDNGGIVYLDGTSGYTRTTDSADFDMGTGDFGIGIWVWPAANQGNVIGADLLTGWALQFSGSGYAQFYNNGVVVAQWASALTLSQWYHLYVSRESGTLRLFVDGIVRDTASYSTAVDADDDLCIGYDLYDVNYFDGYADIVSIVNGRADYTSNFTPPASQPTP